MTLVADLISAERKLSAALAPLRFSPPVARVYNPLEYAARPHEKYLELAAGSGQKKVVFLGMNPGPYGMAQTGVPFGEIPAVRDWMKICEPVGKPPHEHPKRPILGFACPQSEVSGRRLWGLFAQRFGEASNFFKDHFVANYCPLVFMSETGANLTPDKISPREMRPVFAACDEHLHRIIELLKPEWAIGVGGFAEACLTRVCLDQKSLKIARILHPSPASPAANKDWAGNVTRTLEGLGVW
jgi:single-strand selective monofunctional uracil DNA glycosylase